MEDTTLVTPAPLAAITSLEALNAYIADGISRSNFATFPDAIKEHDAYVVDGDGKHVKDAEGKKVKATGETDGIFLSLNLAMPKNTPIRVGDTTLYPSSIRCTLNAFKLQQSPYATGGSSAASGKPLTQDSLKAKLAALANKR